MMFLKLFLKNLKFTFVLNKLYKHQSAKYEILQLSHRLEKGLTLEKKKNAWGLEKANRLITLLEKESATNDPDCIFFLNVGRCVLSKWLEEKKADKQFDDETQFIASRLYTLDNQTLNDQFGGTILLKKRSFDEAIPFKSILTSRHSVRLFSSTQPDLGLILKAVELANRCPSACNRQAFLVHIINLQQRNNIETQTYNAPYFLIVTGLCSAYSKNEIGDAVVSASIYAAYLSLTLNYYGLDACVIKKDIFNDASFNKKARRMLKLKDDEQIVLELAVGFVNDNTKVPVSKRKPLKLLYVNHIEGDNDGGIEN